MFLRSLLAWSVVAFIVAAGPVQAQTEGEISVARRFYEEGLEAEKGGRWEDALAAYDESQVRVTFSLDRAEGEQAIRNSIAYARSSGDFTRDVQVIDVADLAFAP